MTTYSIDDGDSNIITAGLSEHDVWRTAQEIANDRGESVFVYEVGGESEEPTEATEVAPNRPRKVIDATINERGNGFPTAGDYVPGEGNLYRIVEIVGQIQTGRPGVSNWVRAKVELVDWSDCSEDDEYPAEVVTD